MFNEDDLHELAEFQGSGVSVVTIYLDTDLTYQTKEKCKLTMWELFRRLDEEVPQEDQDRIEHFLDFEHDWQARGIAAFSCQAIEFWRVHTVAVPLASAAFIGERPNIKPLASLLDSYKPYGVALVGRDRARLFVVRLGEIAEHDAMTDEELPGRHKQGGWAAQRYQRHVDDRALHNLRDAAQLTARVCRRSECQQLILAGTEQNVAAFRELLPKSLQRLVVGEISMDIGATAAEVLARSQDTYLAVQKERKRELVDAAITAAASGGRGVIGMPDTLAAAQEGRLQTLVMSAGQTAPGYRCSQCGYMSTQPLEKCPFCGGSFERVPDAVNLIVRRVVEDGGNVEVVDESEALEQAGGIGGLLRY